MKANRGFTLIEVLVAIIIAAVAVLSMMSVIVSTFVSEGRADKRQEGAYLIRKAAEQLKVYQTADA
ncbi:MAG: prepilin-type N-terminal cleavage/methylation domain-containing protein, partial [Elusimicrobia bacterium]|nr:prepilin-type N-terminal cleavage/methylation domain-containing protein [Elusimicrobiota bacterium]